MSEISTEQARAQLKKTNAALEKVFRSAWSNVTARELRQARSQTAMTAEYFLSAYQPIADRWAQQLEDAVKPAADMLDGASRALAAAIQRMTTPAGTTQEQLLAEIRGQREWARLRPELDGLSDTTLIARVQEIVPAATDPAMRRLYLEELPAYIRARGIRLPNDFLTTLITSSAPDMIALDRNETRASEVLMVVRYNQRNLTELLATDRWRDLHSMTAWQVDQLFSGSEPQFLTPDKLTLTS